MHMQKQDNKNNFNLRMKYGKYFFLFLFSVVLFGLFKIQVIDYSIYSLKDKKTRYEKVKIPVCRGTIYDRNGKILAMSVPVYSVGIDTWVINNLKEKNLDDIEKKKICDCLGIEKQILKEKMKKPYAILKNNLTVEEYQKIKDKYEKGEIKGIYFVRNYKRVYPNGSHCCHILGFIGKDGNGLEGIELFYDNLLRGREGVVLYLKDGKGNLIPTINKVLIPPEEGKDIYLTVDSNIQFMVEDEIKDGLKNFNSNSISEIVMDPENGEILAMANVPDYSLNFPSKFPESYRRNRCITDFLEPGSVFKIVTGTAAIEEGIFSPDNIIFCENGKYFVRGHYVHDTHKYGDLSFIDVIVKSSNIGTIKIALSLGEEKLYEYCKKFGFGQLTEIDLPGEIKGVLRPLEKWSNYSITAVPIGQEVGITSIQGIRAMAVLSNGGYLVWPHLVKKVTLPDGKDFFKVPIKKRKVISERSCEIMKGALLKVVSEQGTAPLASIEGYKIYGKTGTAQKAENGRYVPGKYCASFIGFLTQNNSNIIISVNVDEPKPLYYGGVVAAPIFKNTMRRILQYCDVPPDNGSEEIKIVLEKKGKK